MTRGHHQVERLRTIPVDAIPDLSDTQVIVYSRWDRSPDIVEDQVTYPIVTALLGAPKVKTIRGFSDFGFSYVYVIFEDGTDIYWARSRVVEYLSKISPSCPRACAPSWARTRPASAGSSSTPSSTTRAAHPRRPAHVPGLDPALPPAVGARGRRGRRPSGASSSSTRSRSTRTASGLRPRDHGGDRRGPPRQRRGGRPPHRVGGQGVHGARAGLRALRAPTSRSRAARRRRGHAGPAARRGDVALGPRSAAGWPTSTASATPWAASWSCATARTPAT
jgi:hypothetical protein